MKFAFIAQTPFQLMNIVKFVYFNNEDSKGNSVVFISDKVASCIFNKDSLISNGLFKKVVTYKKKQYKEDKLLGKIDTAISIVNRFSFEKLIIDCDDKISADIVVVPSVSLESQIFWQYIKHKKVYLIEDGLGTLMGDILQDGMRPGRRKLTKMIYGTFKLDKIYLTNLNINTSNSKVEFKKIGGKFDADFCTYLTNLFLPHDHKRIYHTGDVIYLQQPIWLWDHEYIEQERMLLSKCSNILGDKLIIRCHPLTVNKPRLENVRYDEDNYSWETMCIDQVSEKNVLMGVFSTAQFSLKQICDNEATIIFLHRIIKPHKITQAEIETVIGNLKNSYNDKNKILIPSSEDELLKILEELVYTNIGNMGEVNNE